MVALDDTVGAFVPGPRLERPPLGSGRLSGLNFAVKDLFDIAGSVTTYGNPRLGRAPTRRRSRPLPW